MAGYLAPMALELSDSFRVLESFQRGSDNEPITLAGHIADLHEVVRSQAKGSLPALVGHSWGAMLALAYAAAHPRSIGSLVLIGCGTFEASARGRLNTTLEERTDGMLRKRIERLAEKYPDPNERIRAFGKVTLHLYNYDSSSSEPEINSYEARANQ